MGENSNLEFRKIKSLNYLYEINSNGTIFRNVKSKKQSKIKLDYHHSKDGYYVTFVHLGGRSKNAITKRVMIHVAVAECWLGDKPDGYEVDHIDRNTHNNSYTNLRYVTRSEQMKNRDHSSISIRGTNNLAIARALRMKPVDLIKDGNTISFCSYADCARFLAKEYGASFESMRFRLKTRRSHIKDYDVFFGMQRLDTTTSRGKEQSTNVI